MLVGMLMVFAVAAGILAERAEGEDAPKMRMEWARVIAYWVLTVAVALSRGVFQR